MEDIKQRLKFDDVAIRSKCVQKLVQLVKKKSREIITASSVQIPELNLLWEICVDSSVSTSNLAVRGIIYLVINRHLDINYVINKFLGFLSSESNVYGIVKGITKLLIYQNSLNNESSKTCYSLNRPKHPLISVLQTNEDYLPLVLENIADAISEDNLRGFQIMEPVICYILCNPAPKRRNDYSKSLLIETLLDTVRNEPKTAFYILRCIPLLQIEDCNQVAETANFILKAERAFASLQCDESDRIYISELLLLSALSLSEKCIIFGYDPTRLLDLAINVSKSLSKVSFISSYINICLVSISIILKKASGELIEKYSALAMILLDFHCISPTIAAFLAVSVIQLLPEPSVISFNEISSSILSQLLQKLEKFFLSDQSIENSTLAFAHAKSSEEDQSFSAAYQKCKDANAIYIEAFSFSVQLSQQCAKFAIRLDEGDVDFKLNWLKSVKDTVKYCSSEDLDVMFSVVAALFIMSPDDETYIKACLETFETVLLKNTYLSTKMFSLLLYKQSLLKSPNSKYLILDFLPKSAVHKYAIPPVLSILKMMSTDAELKPQAIYLMLQLWKKHDRCFSYLHKLLLENNKTLNKDLNINETLISQTAAIREICQIAPEKHGIEFLGILSKVFNESDDEANLPVACLALDGVISLCKSEITELRSTWKMLGLKLSRDKRTLVTCRMYKLLTLVPELEVKSCEYDKFMNEISTIIWKRIASGIMAPEAVAEAYRTLAKFPLQCHVLKLLPQPAKVNLLLPASMKATPFEMSKLPEDVLTYIPGYCYIDLLKSIQNEIILKGFTAFLTSLIEQEITELPRSAYNQKKHLQKRQNTNDALSKVPKFLCSQFEARKSPTLQKNIAVGVLICYEPPLEIGKDGEPIKRSLASQSRFFEQVLGVLLNEVNIDATEWQRCILLPSAWGGFMERAFFTCEESRKAELELQRNLGHRDFTPEDFNLQCKCAWLWVRDRLLNVIKTSVKNAPTSHANAIFAIAGLLLASNKFQASLDDSTKALSDDNENFTNHQVFVAEYTETIICAMIPNYQTKGSVHSWLLTHLSRGNSSAGFLVRGCSCACLCHLTLVLLSTHGDAIPTLFQSLLENLSHSSPVFSFYSGLGIGLLIKSLCDVGNTDSNDEQMEFLLNTSKEIQKICLREDTPPPSALIGLTIAVTSLSHVAQDEIKDWISTTCNLFHEKLLEEEVSSMNFEMLSICVTAMIISAVEGNCMPMDNICNLASWFEEKQSELPQCSGVSVSSGMLIETLEKFGHPRGSEIKQKLQKEWFNTVVSEKKNTLHRIAALNGLCSLYSCGRGLLQSKNRETKDIVAVNDLVSLMFQMLNAGRDTGLQNICSWEVGRLFSVHSLQQEAEVSVPANYSYLNEKSVLKPLMKAILTYIDKESNEESQYILSSLVALGGAFPRALPPLNWIAILSPFLQQSENSALAEAALNVAVNQAKGSPYATNILSSYCCPPLFHTLPVTCQHNLLKSIPSLCQVLPPQKLKIFFQTIIPLTIKKEKDLKELGGYTMQGIQDAFLDSTLKQQTIVVLQDAFISIFKYFKKDWNILQKHLKFVSIMICHLQDKTVDSLLSLSRNSSDVASLTAVLCYLVKIGKRKLSALRPCIEEGKHAPLVDKEQIYAALFDCFLTGGSNEKSEVHQPEKCISWFLETIGWINVLSDSKSQYQLITISEVFLFLNDVCFAAIIGCSGLDCSYNWLPMRNLSHQLLLENMPIVIQKIVLMEEWNKVTDKIIEWLKLLLLSPHLNENEKYFIKLSLYGLRNSSEFKKLDIWTDIVSSIY
ncbi:focadhesin [Nephila pilipes]|uniref:Focadhesin n=1 Tax=Nephila pilipes TaxID=299642 RepID=A0A8X6P2P9_NEPPI|nr:focadhesin [Nephila pilipes]